MHLSLVAIFALALVEGLYGAIGTSRICGQDDWLYVYTECDSKGERWRVAVPNPEKCDTGNAPAPVKGQKCEFTCAEGEYLDIRKSQECISCPSGTYSLGGGIRFEDWDHIPDGFTVETENFKLPEFSQQVFHHAFADGATSNCTSAGWVPKGNYIVSMPTNCAASLVFSANLVKAGSVKFEYAYPDDNAVFHFLVQNDQCQAVGDRKANRWPTATEAGEWKVLTVPLTSGLNLLHWKTIGFSSSDAKMKKPVMIRKIEITGVAYTSECTKCKEGTYSSEGAKACTPCQVNMYSGRGEGMCKACDDDQYALPGSSTCSAKPPCSKDDYFEYNSPCDEANMTQVMFKWIEPKICREDLPGAVNLPTSGNMKKCPPCNPGMEFVNGTCRFCPDNQFSDGMSSCAVCPPSTAPEYGIEINFWNNLPDDANITTACLTMNDRGCSSKDGWVSGLSHIHSGKGHADDAYLVLSLDIGGFKGSEQILEGSPITVANISFVFELECTKDCSLFFMKQSESRGTQVIETFTKKQPKQAYSYAIKQTGPVTFSWAFQKQSWDDTTADTQTYNLKNDFAKIHSIVVTNTLRGGSRGCQKCPTGASHAGCIPCPPGTYIDERTGLCTMCLGNTVAHSANQEGLQSCTQCGKGLTQKDHVKCVTDCHYTSPNGHHYDFTKIGGVQSVAGNPLFTTSGTQYYHHFNISLCADGNVFPMVQCADNISVTQEQTMVDKVSGMICRTTLIPPKPGDQEGVLAAQPLSLGDVLVNITSNSSISDHEQIIKTMEEIGFPSENAELDVHFRYMSELETSACRTGRTTVITLRCDPQQKGSGLLLLPPKCMDGTCDGCSFYFLWKTALACPKCTDKDFTVIKGECQLGKQQVHYQLPSYCTGLEAHTKTQACSVLPFWMMIAAGAVVGFGLLLLIIVIYCWKKNRKLEYKYSKLMMTSNKDGELPEVETCALDDGEDEDQFDAVHFKESKRKRLMNKLKSIGSKHGNMEEFEPIRMDKVPLT